MSEKEQAEKPTSVSEVGLSDLLAALWAINQVNMLGLQRSQIGGMADRLMGNFNITPKQREKPGPHKPPYPQNDRPKA